MKIIKEIKILKEEICKFKNKNLTVGFVPTMGALHDGHLSLIKKCEEDNDISIVSIFVNPIQFNNKSDLANYPRTINDDLFKLKKTECNLVFIPDEKEIYPEPHNRIFDLNGLDRVMEGKFRPGHFNGVVTIVTKFFELIKPDRSYFGEKDFQQLTIIKYIVEKMNIPVEIVSCPIVRDYDGLALSSRNKRLSENQRKSASIIPNTLFEARKLKNKYSIKEIKDWVISEINKQKGFEVEYFEIIDNKKLLPINNWNDFLNNIGCIAVNVGNVRLIDNIKFY